MTLTQEAIRIEDKDKTQIGRALGSTVLELIADNDDYIINDRAPDTPPVPFPTSTTSGNGLATITDDSDNEYLYE